MIWVCHQSISWVKSGSKFDSSGNLLSRNIFSGAMHDDLSRPVDGIRGMAVNNNSRIPFYFIRATFAVLWVCSLVTSSPIADFYTQASTAVGTDPRVLSYEKGQTLI